MGIHHMAAIADYDKRSKSIKDGKTLVWGRNHKGQLGIGTNEQKTEPTEVVKLHMQNNRLIDIQCGLTFTIGLTSRNTLMYFGDRLFAGRPNTKNQKDYLEPIQVEALEEVESISACYNKILARTKKGVVYEWGFFLNEQASGKAINIQKFMPVKIESKSNKTDELMKDMVAGPNHS